MSLLRRVVPVVLIALAVGAWAPAISQATLIGGALNRIGDGPQTINFSCCTFTPKDMAVSPGSTTWSGSFVSHPLRFDDGRPGPSTGTAAAFTLSAGVVRYYCGIHGGPGGLGMSGTVYVVGPVAALAATPATLTTPGKVTLDASGTDFVDTTANTTATYEFDVDGDGTFDTTGGTPTTTATFPVGTHTARVRVTDDDGRTGEATVSVRVSDLPATAPSGAGGGAAGDPAPAGGGGTADPGAPSLRAASVQRVTPGALLRGPVTLRPGTVSERATVRASLRLRGKIIGSATAKTVGAGALRVTVRLSAAGRRTIRSLRSATLTLRLELTDADGNRRVVERPVRLRR